MYMAKVNNTVFINHRVRYNGRKINLFDRINKIKNDLKELLPEIEEDKFLSMASHIKNFYYGKLHYGRRNPESSFGRRFLHVQPPRAFRRRAAPWRDRLCAYRWFIA